MIKPATPPSGGGGSGDLSDSNPQPIGTAAAGTAEEASRADHVHAHGNLAGGSLHADATNATDGFATAAQITALEGAVTDIDALETAVTAVEGDVATLQTDLSALEAAAATKTGSEDLTTKTVQLREATPASPASGVTTFAKKTGRVFPAYRSPLATFDKRLQSHLINVGAWARPQGYGSATISIFGVGTFTAYDTAVAAGSYANTDYRTQSKRAMYASGTGANAIGGWRSSAVAFRNSTIGFYACMRFAFGVLPAQRWAAGLSNTTFVGNAEPSASLNWVGVGQDSTDTAFIRFMTNDGSGSATKTLTAFATPTSADVYELSLYSPANSSSLIATLVRLNDGVTESLTISSDLPAVDTALSFHCCAMNMATGTAANVDLMGIYAEHDI